MSLMIYDKALQSFQNAREILQYNSSNGTWSPIDSVKIFHNSTWETKYQKASEPKYLYKPGWSALIHSVGKGTGTGYNDDQIQITSDCIKGYDNWSGMSQQINFNGNIDSRGYTKINFDLYVPYATYTDTSHGIYIVANGDKSFSNYPIFINNYSRKIFTLDCPPTYISNISLGGDMYPGGWWYIYNIYLT